jgi:carbon monoxide dehydrogenase subunit G
MRHLLIAAVLSLETLSPAVPTVTVNEDRGVYAVMARFDVAAPPAVALSVLTDYEQIPRFMPGVKTSVVHERSSGRAVIEQEAVSKFMMFSRRVHLVLEISEREDALSFRDRCRKSFARYEGEWRVTATNGGTALVYVLTAEPSFEVPAFILKRLLERDSKDMIKQLRGEVSRRLRSEPLALSIPTPSPTGVLAAGTKVRRTSSDPGRALQTGFVGGPAPQDDWEKFDATGLRGISRTAPYFHNNSAATLEAVVDHYIEFFKRVQAIAPPGPPPPIATTDGVNHNRQPTAEERAALIAYLRKL